MNGLSEREKQALTWDYYKPRHTHAWNMLVLSWRELDRLNDEADVGFETEYAWENFILRLWLYRMTVKTLERLGSVTGEAKRMLATFDASFDVNGENGLQAIRDMIEHLDEYAKGKGHGPATRESDLDPWRKISRDRYERGVYVLERKSSYEAAVKLRSDAKSVSDKFIQWLKSSD